MARIRPGDAMRRITPTWSVARRIAFAVRKGSFAPPRRSARPPHPSPAARHAVCIWKPRPVGRR